MAIPLVVNRYSPAEYLALERAAEHKSEYIDGELVAMSGASFAHNLIATNITVQLHAQLRDRPCRVTQSDLRVSVADGGLYAYPDVTVVCGEPAFEDEERDTLLNPIVIVEVLSPTTEAFDRGEKFARYRRLTSLQEVLLVAQDRRRVERYVRRGTEWVLSEASGVDAVIELASIGCRLALAEVYAKVPFEPTA